jgi:hypothetical protein
VRTVIFATSFNQQGIHETTFDTLSSLVASNGDIVSITPDDDLVNHQGRCEVGVVWGGGEVGSWVLLWVVWVLLFKVLLF